MAEDTTIIPGDAIDACFHGNRTESVTVRVLPVRQFAKWIELQDDEPALIELVCGRPAGWADTLTPESHVALVGRARDVNLPAVVSWLDRQLTMAATLTGALAPRLKALAAIPAPPFPVSQS